VNFLDFPVPSLRGAGPLARRDSFRVVDVVPILVLYESFLDSYGYRYWFVVEFTDEPLDSSIIGLSCCCLYPQFECNIALRQLADPFVEALVNRL
jgi:hypothetical protein